MRLCSLAALIPLIWLGSAGPAQAALLEFEFGTASGTGRFVVDTSVLPSPLCGSGTAVASPNASNQCLYPEAVIEVSGPALGRWTQPFHLMGGDRGISFFVGTGPFNFPVAPRPFGVSLLFDGTFNLALPSDPDAYVVAPSPFPSVVPTTSGIATDFQETILTLEVRRADSPIPEPGAALAFLVGAIVVGGACRRSGMVHRPEGRGASRSGNRRDRK